MEEKFAVLTQSENDLAEFIVKMTDQPFTVDELIDNIGGSPRIPRGAMKLRLDNLAKKGWLVKSSRRVPHPGRPPSTYKAAPGASLVWNERDTAYREAFIQQQQWDDELLA